MLDGTRRRHGRGHRPPPESVQTGSRLNLHVGDQGNGTVAAMLHAQQRALLPAQLPAERVADGGPRRGVGGERAAIRNRAAGFPIMMGIVKGDCEDGNRQGDCEDGNRQGDCKDGNGLENPRGWKGE
eukprot:gene3067-biopygen1444